jgi:N-acetylneuraminic acid mutarotase
VRGRAAALSFTALSFAALSTACAAPAAPSAGGSPTAAPGDVAPGTWAERAPLLTPNSEFAVAAVDGKIYVLGGYPSTRVTVNTVQVYDTATNTWSYGPPLPQVNNHGMAAAVGGHIYLIGGQTTPEGDQSYVDTVYQLDPARGTWVTKAPMPTKRSAGVALVLGTKIYVAGGRPPRGNDFAVYDTATDHWEALPNLPTQRNHIAGAVIDSRIHVVSGRLGYSFVDPQTAVHEVYDPATRTWSSAAPMLRPRSGINGVLAQGCFYVWGGEWAEGLFPDVDVYDPRNDRWTHLADMPVPVHGVTGGAYINGLIYATGGGTHTGGSHGSLHNQVYRPPMSCQ